MLRSFATRSSWRSISGHDLRAVFARLQSTLPRHRITLPQTRYKPVPAPRLDNTPEPAIDLTPQVHDAPTLDSPKEPGNNGWRSRIRSGFLSVGIMVGFYIVLHSFVEHVYEGSWAYGTSMMPTLNSYGDFLIISKWYRRGRGIQLGDLVSYKHPVMSGQEGVKRVVGMPGDFVLRDTPGKGDGYMIQVPTGHCYVVGDNLSQSRDSRHFGPIPLALVTGKIVGVLQHSEFPYIRTIPDWRTTDE